MPVVISALSFFETVAVATLGGQMLIPCLLPERFPSAVSTACVDSLFGQIPAGKGEVVLRLWGRCLHGLSWKPTTFRGTATRGVDRSTTTVFWPCFASIQARSLPATPLPITKF